MSYQNWENRMANKRVLTAEMPDADDEGYYRKPITEKQPNGRNKIVGFIPIALFLDGETLVAHIGMGDSLREIDTPEQMADADFWTWCCRYPISDKLYFEVVRDGKPWPDLPPVQKAVSEGATVRAAKPDEKSTVEEIPAANRAVKLTDNQPPPDEEAELPLDVKHAKIVDDLIGKAPRKIVNNDEANEALGIKNKLAEARLNAEKAGKSVYDPLYRAYTAEQKKWSPIGARAKKEEDLIQKAILAFRESERVRIAAENAAREKAEREAAEAMAAEQARLDEINARAADRAIARGEPEPEPLVIEPEPVMVATPAAPPPATPAPLAPTYGSRKVREEVHTILDQITDYDAVYQFVKDDPKTRAFLLEMATAKIKAGITVPGTKTREGLI